MKSKKLELDESLFDDETIEIELPAQHKAKAKELPSSKNRKKIEFKVEETRNRKQNVNNQRVSPNNKAALANRLNSANNNDSIASDYEFEPEIQRKTHNVENPKPAIEYLNFDTDSHLTIKTKKSSKFSIQPPNTSAKFDTSDSKKVSSRHDPNKKKTQFALENELREGKVTMHKLTTPPASTNQTRKNFKFDISLLSKKDDKKGRVVYPHSCKNANMMAILEADEINRNSPMNTQFVDHSGSIDFSNIKNSAEKMASGLNSNFKASKISERSDNKSANVLLLNKKIHEYELKIDRLHLDQKFKIQNYKRMLEEKDTIINELRTDLNQYRNKCAELEETIALGKLINTEDRSNVTNTDNNSNQQDGKSMETSMKKTNNEYYSSSAITNSNSPFLKLKKLNINVDEVNEKDAVQITQFNPTKPLTTQNKFRTPNTFKDRKSFKLHVNTNSNTQESLKNIKETGSNIKYDKSASNNLKNFYKDLGYKPKGSSKLVSPVKPKTQLTSSLQYSKKSSHRKIKPHDSKINDSSKVKSKKLKISETPKLSRNDPNYYAPNKNFFVHYKKDQFGKANTSNKDIKKWPVSVKSKELWGSRVEKGLNGSREVNNDEITNHCEALNQQPGESLANKNNEQYLDFTKKPNDKFFTSKKVIETAEADVKIKFYKKPTKEALEENDVINHNRD